MFTAINSVVGVRNSYLFSEKSLRKFTKKIEASFNFIFFMGFACCFGIMGIAKTFVPLFLAQGTTRLLGYCTPFLQSLLLLESAIVSAHNIIHLVENGEKVQII